MTEANAVQPRVLVIPSSYLAGDRTVGGGERYALEYARALSRLTPTTLGLFDRAPARELDGELEIRTFGVRRLDPGLGFPLTFESWRALKGFDVIHIMIFPTPLTDLLLLMGRMRGQTVVLTDVGGGIPSWSTYLRKLHPRADLNRLADGLALLSRHASGLFADWPQPRTILYGGADCRLPSAGIAEEPSGRYALFVGRLLPHKGILPLIESIG
ncbi:MAG TPA: hypothetical protein VHG28_08805, partial [Longimicrobiaceae bacterium]|nr:hypothetical protein [Longimicrobiaceae bacterium]